MELTCVKIGVMNFVQIFLKPKAIAPLPLLDSKAYMN